MLSERTFTIQEPQRGQKENSEKRQCFWKGNHQHNIFPWVTILCGITRMERFSIVTMSESGSLPSHQQNSNSDLMCWHMTGTSLGRNTNFNSIPSTSSALFPWTVSQYGMKHHIKWHLPPDQSNHPRHCKGIPIDCHPRLQNHIGCKNFLELRQIKLLLESNS